MDLRFGASVWALYYDCAYQPLLAVRCLIMLLIGCGVGAQHVYLEKIRVLKAGLCACMVMHGILEQDFGSILLLFSVLK